jgi:hypothetical protein
VELAQTKHCFDQLMQKYNNQKEKETQYISKINDANQQIGSFKQLFDEAQRRY